MYEWESPGPRGTTTWKPGFPLSTNGRKVFVRSSSPAKQSPYFDLDLSESSQGDEAGSRPREISLGKQVNYQKLLISDYIPIFLLLKNKPKTRENANLSDLRLALGREIQNKQKSRENAKKNSSSSFSLGKWTCSRKSRENENFRSSYTL